MPSLPNELWLLALSNLSTDTDSSTLASLCRVSRQLRGVAQPTLYSKLSIRHFQSARFFESAHEASNSQALCDMVREVSLESFLGYSSPPRHPSPAHEPWDYTFGLLSTALSNSEAQWDSDRACLMLCPNITKFRFTLDANLQDYDDYTDTIVYFSDQVFIPSSSNLLALPFISNLNELYLYSPNGVVIDVEVFGEVILAAPQLIRLSLHLIDAKSLFRPVIKYMAEHDAYQLPLSFLHWDESYDRQQETGILLEPFVHMWTGFTSIRNFSFTGLWVYFDDILPQPAVWSQIVDLTFEQQCRAPPTCRPVLQDLATLFPNTRKLHLLVPQIDLVLPAQISFKHLTHLSIRFRESSHYHLFREDLYTQIRELLTQRFGPLLQELRVGVDQLEDESDDSRLDKAQRMMCSGVEDCQDVASSMLRYTIEDGSVQAVYERRENGRFGIVGGNAVELAKRAMERCSTPQLSARVDDELPPLASA